MKQAGESGHALWDVPTRVFHWGIVCCIPLSWWSAENDYYDVHEWVGYTVITLVVSRILWGFLGSPHSRFGDFLVGPRRVLAYLRGQGYSSAGHNPLGGWSVVVLLVLLLLQATSGLFNADDVLFSGPLYYAADSDFRDVMGVVHDAAFNGLMVLVVLHIVAVVYHQRKKGEKLVQAMLRGRSPGREGRLPLVSTWRALVVLSLVAAALWWGLQQAPQPVLMW